MPSAIAFLRAANRVRALKIAVRGSSLISGSAQSLTMRSTSTFIRSTTSAGVHEPLHLGSTQLLHPPLGEGVGLGFGANSGLYNL